MSSFVEISVLLCVYNAERYVSRAVESILNQSFQNFEFLIIDDASTDSTLDILSGYAQTDERIKVIKNFKNMGLGYCLHLGVKQAKGLWIARMDGDDIADIHRLETQLEYVKKYPKIDVLGSYAIDIDECGSKNRLRTVPLSQDEIYRYVWTNPFIHSTVFFNKERIISIGSYNPKARKRQDYELWFRCVKNGFRLANLDQPLMFYRYSEATLNRNNYRVTLQQAFIGWKGCFLIKAPITAYLGVAIPFLKSLFPPSIQARINILLRRFDPRAKSENV